MDSSILLLDGRRGHPLLEVLVVELAGDKIKGDCSFVVDSALHFLHGLFCLFFGFVLNEQVARVCAKVFVIFADEPVVNDGSKLRKPLE